jgi:hypothetical protein
MRCFRRLRPEAGKQSCSNAVLDYGMLHPRRELFRHIFFKPIKRFPEEEGPRLTAAESAAYSMNMLKLVYA